MDAAIYQGIKRVTEQAKAADWSPGEEELPCGMRKSPDGELSCDYTRAKVICNICIMNLDIADIINDTSTDSSGTYSSILAEKTTSSPAKHQLRDDDEDVGEIGALFLSR